MDRRSFIVSTGALALASALPKLAYAAPPAGADGRLAALLDAFFNEDVDRSPETATSLGLDKGARGGMKSRLDDYSDAARIKDLADSRDQLARLRGIDRAALSEAWAVNYDVVEYQLARGVASGERYTFGGVQGYYAPYVISQLNGPYYGVPAFLDSSHVIETKADADAYIARLSAFPAALDQSLARQQADAARGIFAPDFCLDLALGQLRSLRDKPAAGAPLVESVVRRAKAKGIAGDYAGRAEKIVAGGVYPALDRQIAELVALRAKATHDAGVWRLPGGDEYYAGALRNATTTELSPDEVHRIGLDQVAELSGRIDAILKSEGRSKGSVGERLTALNADPSQIYANDDAGRTALIASLNGDIKALYPRLPKAFSRVPKAPVEVRRVPEFIQDGAPNGYYDGAALDGSRGAIYWINLKDTHDWPKYGLHSLTYHESVPGHHLQISLAQESDAIPMIRKVTNFGAYVEGWALYAEQLADELGMYEGNPLGRAGMLQSFLFRATRLVVDTGIHAKRWSREKATDYMVAQTGFPVPRTQREVDRYCVWPGQACSYKVGHNMWEKVRADAQKRLGARFDLRDFHDVLLLGAMPLTILERTVDARVRARMT